MTGIQTIVSQLNLSIKTLIISPRYIGHMESISLLLQWFEICLPMYVGWHCKIQNNMVFEIFKTRYFILTMPGHEFDLRQIKGFNCLIVCCVFGGRGFESCQETGTGYRVARWYTFMPKYQFWYIL
jgi:hypothetical protein